MTKTPEHPDRDPNPGRPLTDDAAAAPSTRAALRAEDGSAPEHLRGEAGGSPAEPVTSPEAEPVTAREAWESVAPPAGEPLTLREAEQVTSPEAGEAVSPPAVLDERTFDRIPEPRGEGRLPLGDGTWHQLARAYVRVQLISQGAFLLVVLAAAIALQAFTGVVWHWIPAGVILLITALSLAITPRQARSFGYQLRRDDLVFRRGILWQRVVAVPYGRMQLVDITHGPVDRGFGIAQLKLVTAAASTSVTIPGLTQQAAEQLRDTLIDVAETRRTGL